MKYTFSQLTKNLVSSSLVAVAVASLGCVPAPPPAAAPGGATPAATGGAHHPGDGHDHSHDGGHGHSHDGGGHEHVLKVTIEGGEAVAEKPIELVMTVRDEEGQAITKFDAVHEHPIHLIVVREGLDHFFHLHPAVDASGVATTPFTFPVAGKWHLFADHAAAGHGEAVARALLEVSGAATPAAALDVTAPGQINGQGGPNATPLTAEVSVAPSADGKEAKITFDLVADGKPATGLQKHLGAAGHLVVISADAKQYVHTHPVQADAAAHVEFDAHLPAAGKYKGWAQFKQNGNVYTFPFVFEAKPAVK